MKLDKKQKMPIYSAIAPFYDRLMKRDKYEIWKELIKKTIRKYRIPKTKAIDIACGTGRISEMLFDLGFEVTGIDKSIAMLRVARKKYSKIDFICQDICKISLSDKTDFAVSFYDSLNYLLTDRKMLTMFNKVAKHLNPGSIFLFDMNTREKILVFQKHEPQVYEDKDFFIVFKHGGKNRLWKIEIDFFIKKTNNVYIRETECHIEKGYSEKDIRRILKKTPLKLLDIKKEVKYYNDKQYLDRLYFTVRKESQ